MIIKKLIKINKSRAVLLDKTMLAALGCSEYVTITITGTCIKIVATPERRK